MSVNKLNDSANFDSIFLIRATISKRGINPRIANRIIPGIKKLLNEE
jgi:hypothetical protein